MASRGRVAAVGDEDDAGEALALEVFDGGAERGEDLGGLAFGFEFVEGGDEGSGGVRRR